MKTKITKKHLAYILPIIILSLALYVFSNSFETNEIRSFIDKAGIWGSIIYILLLTSTYVIAPLSGTPIFIAGFLAFGKIFIIYNYLATVLGAIINFWISRIWGRGLVKKFVGRENMAKINEFTQNYGVKTLIFFRVFQGHLHDFISYAYGLTNMRFFPYLIVSLLAPIPWLFLWWLVLFPRINTVAELTFYLVISIAPFYIISIVLVAKYKKITS